MVRVETNSGLILGQKRPSESTKNRPQNRRETGTLTPPIVSADLNLQLERCRDEPRYKIVNLNIAQTLGGVRVPDSRRF